MNDYREMPHCEACEERKRRAAMRSFRWVRRGVIAAAVLLLSAPFIVVIEGWRESRDEDLKVLKLGSFVPVAGQNLRAGLGEYSVETYRSSEGGLTRSNREDHYYTSDAGTEVWKSCYVLEVSR